MVSNVFIFSIRHSSSISSHVPNQRYLFFFCMHSLLVDRSAATTHQAPTHHGCEAPGYPIFLYRPPRLAKWWTFEFYLRSLSIYIHRRENTQV